MKKLLGKVIGYTMAALTLIGMTTILYTGNTTYLNLVTVWYSILMILGWVFVPLQLVVVILGKVDRETLLKVKDGVKPRSTSQIVYHCVMMTITVVLMSLLGFTFLPIMYVITSGFVLFVKMITRSVVEDELEKFESVVKE